MIAGRRKPEAEDKKEKMSGKTINGKGYRTAWGVMTLLFMVLSCTGCRLTMPDIMSRIRRPATKLPEPEAITLPDPIAIPVLNVQHQLEESLDGHIGQTRLRVLQSGDRLEIYLHGIPESQNLPVVVDENGYITMPLIGQVRTAGKTASQLERLIEILYVEQDYYRSITCVVIPPRIEFFVRGEVRQPGRYPLTRDITLLQAIALAGGYTEYAQPRRINILRGSESFTVNARNIERGNKTSPPIKAGDVVVVPRRWW